MSYMGTRARPWSMEAECWCLSGLSSSRGTSLSMGGIVWQWLGVCVCDGIGRWVGQVECEDDRWNARMRCDGCDSGYLPGPTGCLASSRVADSKPEKKMRREAAKLGRSSQSNAGMLLQGIMKSC
jgi:hypothetical protein